MGLAKVTVYFKDGKVRVKTFDSEEDAEFWVQNWRGVDIVKNIKIEKGVDFLNKRFAEARKKAEKKYLEENPLAKKYL